MSECLISRRGGSNRNLYSKPTLNINYPSDHIIYSGDKIDIYVSIEQDGYPSDYSYQWYLDDQAVNGANNNIFTFSSNVNYIGTHIVYCIISNIAGSIISRKATITVNPVYIFKNGAFVNTSYSGAITGSNSNNASGIGITNNMWHIYADSPNTQVYSYTTNAFDVTNRTHIIFTLAYMDVLDASNVGTAFVGVSGSHADNNYYAYYAFTPYNWSGSSDLYIDISHLSGNVYIKISIIRGDIYYQDHIYFSEVKLV